MKKAKLFAPLWEYIKQDKVIFIFFVVISFARTITSLLYGYLFGKATSYLVVHEFENFVFAMILYGLYSLIDVGILLYFKRSLYNKLETNFIKRISVDLFQKALCLPVTAYDKHTVGEVVNRIYTDPNKVIESLDRIVLTAARVITALFIIVVAMTLSWLLTVELIIVIILNYLLSQKYHPQFKQNQEKISKLSDKYVADANQVLFGIRDVKGLGLKNKMNQLMGENIETVTEEQVKSRNFELYYNISIEVLIVVSEFIIFITLGYLVFNGEIVMTMFLAFNWYIWRIFDIAREVTQLGVVFQKVEVAVTRIVEILQNKLYADDYFGNKQVSKIKGNIEFKKVSFAYNEDKEVLTNLSLKINTGKKVAIVGKSGQGKSTIFNLLLRFYEPTNGEILIDGIKLTDFDEESLRKHIAIIRQEPYIFNKTISENFKLIKEDITLEEIKKLCKLVYIDDYIETLPDKYDTLIGEGGVNLSGGQKQRLAIARSLAKDSKIMLFDESTSALDNESQAYIKQTIDELAKNHTIIIVAHRLSTIVDADIIFLIEDGKVLASGTHMELLKENEIYRKLYKPELLELNV